MSVPADFWLFLSGVFISLSANLLTSWRLSTSLPISGTSVVLAASCFAFASYGCWLAYSYRKAIEESWLATPGAEADDRAAFVFAKPVAIRLAFLLIPLIGGVWFLVRDG